MKTRLNIFWFRRDLRFSDNAGLFHALQAGLPVLPIFIFDRNILERLDNPRDRRVEFIYETLLALQQKLAALQSSLQVFYGRPAEVFSELCRIYAIGRVFTNEDYEPYALERDAEVETLLQQQGVGMSAFKDQVIFSKQEVVKEDGMAYTVFTPYSRKWKSILFAEEKKYLQPFLSENYLERFFKQEAIPLPSLESMGFIPTGKNFPAADPDPDILRHYEFRRDFPGLDATSRLGIHLRFGTVSIRVLAQAAIRMSPVFLNELIWRDFYQMILWHFPRVGKGLAFKRVYDHIPWHHDEEAFKRWCDGLTGYPLVDAGMRQLNETGFMHNRVRMVTASFLAKHLLIDWRWGEAYFARQLLDFDLASNNGGWQWAAGCGCDAAPYFRIFNPALQQKKFDPEGSYIRRWLPDYQEGQYPRPIVDHDFARKRAIDVYRKALTTQC